MTLGEKIKYLRKKEKMSQEDLADKIGIASAHLSKLENDKFQPSLEVLRKLIEVFQVSADYLLSQNEQQSTNIFIDDPSFARRIELLNSLEGKDKEVIFYLIDSILAKKKALDLLSNSNTVVQL